MKNLLSVLLIITVVNCFAQSDTTHQYRHRLWINPSQIVTGQYTLAYELRLYKSNWIGVGGGYRYIPYSLVEKLPIAPQSFFELLADPEYGVGFTGPVIFATYSYYHHWKNIDGLYVEFFYQHFSHPPDCYYEPSDNDNSIHYTYSATKDVYGAKVFLLFNIPSGHHVLWQFYAGVGLHLRYGEATRYYYKPHSGYPAGYCVMDVNDPDVLAEQIPFKNVFLIPGQVGFRLGFQ